MEKSTIQRLGKSLRQEFQPLGDLPIRIQEALRALAEKSQSKENEQPNQNTYPPEAS